jgi:hypothetical protein
VKINASEDDLNKALDMLTDPIEDLGKAKFMPLHRADDERVRVRGFDLDVEAIAAQENIGCGESDALIAVEETMVVSERLHQGGRFFFYGVVIPGLRTEYGGLNSSLVADTMETSEQLDQSMLHPVDFRHREVIRHLAFYFARRCNRSRLRATDCSKASITSGRTRCWDGTTLCR